MTMPWAEASRLASPSRFSPATVSTPGNGGGRARPGRSRRRGCRRRRPSRRRSVRRTGTPRPSSAGQSGAGAVQRHVDDAARRCPRPSARPGDLVLDVRAAGFGGTEPGGDGQQLRLRGRPRRCRRGRHRFPSPWARTRSFLCVLVVVLAFARGMPAPGQHGGHQGAVLGVWRRCRAGRRDRPPRRRRCRPTTPALEVRVAGRRRRCRSRRLSRRLPWIRPRPCADAGASPASIACPARSRRGRAGQHQRAEHRRSAEPQRNGRRGGRAALLRRSLPVALSAVRPVARLGPGATWLGAGSADAEGDSVKNIVFAGHGRAMRPPVTSASRRRTRAPDRAPPAPITSTRPGCM